MLSADEYEELRQYDIPLRGRWEEILSLDNKPIFPADYNTSIDEFVTEFDCDRSNVYIRLRNDVIYIGCDDCKLPDKALLAQLAFLKEKSNAMYGTTGARG